MKFNNLNLPTQGITHHYSFLLVPTVDSTEGYEQRQSINQSTISSCLSDWNAISMDMLVTSQHNTRMASCSSSPPTTTEQHGPPTIIGMLCFATSATTDFSIFQQVIYGVLKWFATQDTHLEHWFFQEWKYWLSQRLTSTMTCNNVKCILRISTVQRYNFTPLHLRLYFA